MKKIILAVALTLMAGVSQASTERTLHEDTTLLAEAMAHCPAQLAELVAKDVNFGPVKLAIPRAVRPANADNFVVLIETQHITLTTWIGGHAPIFERSEGPTLTVTQVSTYRDIPDAPPLVEWTCSLSQGN